MLNVDVHNMNNLNVRQVLKYKLSGFVKLYLQRHSEVPSLDLQEKLLTWML